MPGSTVIVNDVCLTVKLNTPIGDKWDVFKGAEHTGRLDCSDFRHFSIILKRNDGGTDVFKLEQQGYAELYILSKSSIKVMSFDLSLNPLHLTDRYKITLFPNTFSDPALEELMFYGGEILYRKISLQSARH